MTDTVLRAHSDVTAGFLTEVLRDAGLIGDATVVDAPAETVGAGLMGICARYHLRLDRDVPGAPRTVVGKFAAQDATAREFMASSGYRNELCFYQHFASKVSINAPRCAHAAIDDDGWFTLILEDCAPMEPGDQLRGCTVGQVEAAVRELVGLHAPLWDAEELETHACFADRVSVEPELLVVGLQAVVPGFLDRYGATFAPDEVGFYERLGGVGRQLVRGPPRRTFARAQRLPARQPPLLARRSGRRSRSSTGRASSRGSAMSDVSFLIGNALDARGTARARRGARARVSRRARRGRGVVVPVRRVLGRLRVLAALGVAHHHLRRDVRRAHRPR